MRRGRADLSNAAKAADDHTIDKTRARVDKYETVSASGAPFEDFLRPFTKSEGRKKSRKERERTADRKSVFGKRRSAFSSTEKLLKYLPS